MTTDGDSRTGTDPETRKWRDGVERRLARIEAKLEPLVNEHDEEAIRSDERAKNKQERRDWWSVFLKYFFAGIGALGTIFGIAVGLYALLGGGP